MNASVSGRVLCAAAVPAWRVLSSARRTDPSPKASSTVKGRYRTAPGTRRRPAAGARTCVTDPKYVNQHYQYWFEGPSCPNTRWYGTPFSGVTTRERRMRSGSKVREAPEKARPQSPPAPNPLESGVRPAALLAVMMEQIEYLAGHAVEACPTGCADCARLEQVKRWLLAPFC